jgi:predicted nucleic acid-binding protein
MRILLDTNVILDVLLDREPWVPDAAQVWRMCSDGRLTGFVCASSMTNIFYIARRLTDLTRARGSSFVSRHLYGLPGRSRHVGDGRQIAGP